jgi:hypothetical protein
LLPVTKTEMILGRFADEVLAFRRARRKRLNQKCISNFTAANQIN